MNRSVESALRFINLTTSGLLAGSLGFGEAALVPGWEEERSMWSERDARVKAQQQRYFNSIGPLALASAMSLAIGTANHSSTRRALDVVSTLSLAGVLAATVFVTVPINKKLDTTAPVDYPSQDSFAMQKNFGRAHALRTALGISAFVCAVISNVTTPPSR